MHRVPEDAKLNLLYAAALLRSESADDYDLLRNTIRRQLMPLDYIEEIWVAENVNGEWETRRLRWCKTVMIKTATPRAIRNLLESLGFYDSDYVHDLAMRYFTNKSIRRKVLAILRDFHLDDSAIDAEALRLSMPDLAAIDRRLTELALRRDKNLQLIENRRAGLATRIQASSDQCLNRDAVLSLEHGEA